MGRPRRASARIALRAALAAAALGVLGTAGAPAHAGASTLVEITIPAPAGAIPDTWLAYPGPPRAKVLLPDGYDPAKAYPLLVLLAGANSTYNTWSHPSGGRITTTLAGFPGIVVMPEGATGFYTDWWNNGRRGEPSWESYHLETVIPEILKRYPIRPERRYHALAGVSLGGLGAAYLGGRLPGFFGSVAVLSGVVSLKTYPAMVNVASMLPQIAARQRIDPFQVYGQENGFYANGHDPPRLAQNLRHTRVFIAAGNGQQTQDGEPNPNVPAVDRSIEALLVRPASDRYARSLRAAGVDLHYQRHAGSHDVANFRRELRDAVTWDLFAPVEQEPAQWVNDTVATRGELWTYTYRFEAPPKRIVRFERNGDRLAVSAAGSPVTITTADGCVVQIETPGAIRGCTPEGEEPDPGTTEALQHHTARGTTFPSLVYTPASYRADRAAPLLVMVHGCQTTAEQQMQASLYNRLAEREGIVVLYPDVDRAMATRPRPLQNCWRFFDPASWRRGGGDAAAIAGMTREVMAARNIDPERVYLIGMSAGGFMTSIMAAAYPDLYAAVGINAAGAYADAGCLAGNPVTLPVAASAALARREMGPRARVVPRLVMGGGADRGIVPRCHANALQQGLRTNNLALSGDQTRPLSLAPADTREERNPGGHPSTVLTYRDPDGCLVAERWIIHGMGHYWPGGSSSPAWKSWTDPRGPSGAEISWRFFQRYTRSATEMPCAEAQ